MKKYIYANDYETYIIYKVNNDWIVEQDDVWSNKKYKTLKDAKKAVDNQEIYF